MNLLYLAIFHSGANGVSPLRHYDKAVDQWRIPGCVHVLRLKAIILNICYKPLLISVVI